MSDIVERLRAITGQAGDHGDVRLCDEAAAEIERLRAQPCPYVTGSVTHYCTLTPFTLTDAERQVITWAANAMRPECRATLRGLLERTTGGQ